MICLNELWIFYEYSLLNNSVSSYRVAFCWRGIRPQWILVSTIKDSLKNFTPHYQSHRAKKPLDDPQIICFCLPLGFRCAIEIPVSSSTNSSRQKCLCRSSSLAQSIHLMTEIKFMSHNGVLSDNLFCGRMRTVFMALQIYELLIFDDFHTIPIPLVHCDFCCDFKSSGMVRIRCARRHFVSDTALYDLGILNMHSHHGCIQARDCVKEIGAVEELRAFHFNCFARHKYFCPQIAR